MDHIDAHAHVWTADTQRYPLAAGFRRWNMQPRDFPVARLQEEMQRVGVHRAVLIQPAIYGYDNSYMLDAISEFPGAFSGVAVVDQNERRPDLQMRMFKQVGVRGFRIYPKNEPPDNWLGSACMQRMFDTAAEEELSMCCLIDPDDLPALDRMCSKFPDTTVVIDHLCRIGAGGDGLIEQEDVRQLCNMARHQRTYVKVSAFYGLGEKKPPYHDLAPFIRRVYDTFGPARLMWGSDSPFQAMNGHTYRDSIDLVREGFPFLNHADKEWLLSKTAERVFFQESP